MDARGRGIRTIVAAAIGVTSPSVAAADAWYFQWRCAGACAPHQLETSGVEGPFGSESSCDQARRQKQDWVLGPGNLGAADGCVEAGAGGPPVVGASGPVSQAHLATVRLGGTAGAGYDAAYASGVHARGHGHAGAELDFGFGRETFGLAVLLGLERDSGTASDVLAAEPLWMVELGVGLVTSPFALIERPTLELRPRLGLYGINVIRAACGTRCEYDIPAGKPGEATNAFGGRLVVGLEAYLGAGRRQGVALDAIVNLYKVGDFTDPTVPTSVELTPPQVMVRLSWIWYRDR
jgi:hypothetical protein